MVRDQIGKYVYPVHRLDKPTSGVLIFALSSEVAKLLSEKFACHRLLLHANKLSFTHPVLDTKIVIEARFDEVFQRVYALFK